MSDTPITLLARKEIAQNSVYRVCFDHIRGEGGEEVSNFLSIVPHALGGDQLAGVSVLPIANGKVGLLEVWRHPLGRACLEVPRGFIDAGETAAVAAIRELQEETGIEVGEKDLLPLGFFTPEAALVEARGALFAAQITENTGSARDEMGHSAFHWIEESVFTAMLARGEIEDSATNIAWLRYSLNKGGQHG